MHVMAGAQHEFSQICKNLNACLYLLKMLSLKNADQGGLRKNGESGLATCTNQLFLQKKKKFFATTWVVAFCREIPRGIDMGGKNVLW